MMVVITCSLLTIPEARQKESEREREIERERERERERAKNRYERASNCN